MLIEVRKILFPLEVLKQSFLNECKVNGIEVPNSQVQNIKINGEKSPKVIMQFMTANPDAPIDMPLSENFVLTSMILTCRDYLIPLPRLAEKTIQAHNDQLAMVISHKVTRK